MPLVNVNGVKVFLPDGYTYSNQPGQVSTPTLNAPNSAPSMPPPAPSGSPAPSPTQPVYPLTPTQVAWQNSQKILQGKRQQLLTQYGLTEKGELDPNLQYSQARQLLGRYGQQLELARMENAGRGVGAHGISQQRDHLIRNVMGAASYALTQDFLGRLAGVDLDISKLGPRPNI